MRLKRIDWLTVFFSFFFFLSLVPPQASYADGADGLFKGVDLIAICVGKADDDKSTQKSSILQVREQTKNGQ